MIIDSPRISILIPAWNVEKYIGECIDSCLDQTFDDFELRIHDDGSTDHTPDIIASYKDSRIVFTRSEKNEGSLNAVRHLDDFSADYVLYADSDDVLDPHTLEISYSNAMRMPDVGMWLMSLGHMDAPRALEAIQRARLHAAYRGADEVLWILTGWLDVAKTAPEGTVCHVI